MFEKGWKPLNYTMILSTLSFCDIAEFLFRNGFDFILGHRFTQDATENVFSQIRRKEGKMPSALQSLRAIKSISVAQFVSDIKTTSYFNDSDVYLLDYCSAKRQLGKSSAAKNANPNLDVTSTLPEEIRIQQFSYDDLTNLIDDYDAKNIFHLAGSCINAISNSIYKTCLEHLVKKNLPDDHFTTNARLYTRILNLGGLKEPCLEVFHLILSCEYVFNQYRQYILRNGNSTIINRILQTISTAFPPCYCDVKNRLVKHFFTIRGYCIRNYSKASKKRKNIYGTASCKKIKI